MDELPIHSDPHRARTVIPIKRYYTIGEVSELCGVKPHVLRYWEIEFRSLNPMKRRGNRRLYNHTDLQLVKRIRRLLYEEGLTIAGARRHLADDGPTPEAIAQAGVSREAVLERVIASSTAEFDPIPEQRHFTLGEVSELCGVKPHVLRYWEQEFPLLHPAIRRGNRRYYKPEEVQLVRRIRQLLYTEGYTVTGAKLFLEDLAIGPSSSLVPLQVELIGVGATLSKLIINDPSLITKITPAQYEELICDRLYAMGFEPRQVGNTNRKDGGVDIVFWPRTHTAFPFLGAAQIKHHRDPAQKEGPATIREFAGVMAGHPFHAGLIVTNTTFSPDAMWFAREHASLLKLRDVGDVRRWLLNNFSDEQEWREIPASIELCPGVIVRIR